MNLLAGMSTTINTKQLRALLPRLVARVRKGARFTVLYRSQRAFHIVPIDDLTPPAGDYQKDSLYRAKAVGSSRDGRSAADHDAILYGK